MRVKSSVIRTDLLHALFSPPGLANRFVTDESKERLLRGYVVARGNICEQSGGILRVSIMGEGDGRDHLAIFGNQGHRFHGWFCQNRVKIPVLPR